ncbi:RNA demethylase ALKBH5 [Heracleum sosnowskyi]|uniref:RNA demethylase ALKBH5 n=1 Tax=Heracleum sosnowskyi TaxID=360622 RepID=A0AAD8H549_9APIA|nr:RNA demethylase ALKBH5 [Heracleum sosnowskyi]
MTTTQSGSDKLFLRKYSANDRRIASEFLSDWLPFLTNGLCNSCNIKLTHRVRSLRSADDNDKNSVGSWKDGVNDAAETNSLGIWKDGENGCVEPSVESGSNEFSESGANGCSMSGAIGCSSDSIGMSVPAASGGGRMSWADANGFSATRANGRSMSGANGCSSDSIGMSAPAASGGGRMSWADMAQEDELEGDEESEVTSRLSFGNSISGDGIAEVKVASKQVLSRDQREYLRFINVERKKDFACFERINTKFVNILDGLELHTGVFSAVEQKRIVDYVYELEEMGRNGKLKVRTYTAPQKWMRGKGRVTIQFGCCYNYAPDKKGNPPGILHNELVDKIPHLFKVIIRRLIKWHVLPTTCVPDSCIVNIYDKDDCIPPHIDNHDFVRPFCTVSFLSECDIVFGSNLKIIGPGEFSGSFAIPLPVGSVLVLNGNGADVAKHCVPAVPTKRISITFRKMDESKWPVGFTPEPDLQGLQPLSYEVDRSKHSSISKINRPAIVQGTRSVNNRDRLKERGSLGPGLRRESPLNGPRRESPLNR